MTDILVINRYNENLQWINDISNKPFIKKIIVYNKGNIIPYDLDNKIKIINVENIGREGETYLSFIIDNYDNLVENIWFLQADPFDHSPDFMNFFKLGIKMKFESFQNLTCKYKYDFPPNHELVSVYNINNTRCSKFFFDKITLDLVGNNYGKIEKITEDYEKETGFKVEKKFGIYDNLCNQLEISRPKKIMTHTVSACFFVNNSLIKRHPKKTYIKLIEYLIENNFKYKIRGYVLERFWNYLFTGISYSELTECYSKILNHNFIGIFDSKKKIIIYFELSYQYKVVQDINCFIVFKNDKVLPHLKIIGKKYDIDECYNLNEAKLLYKKKLFLKNKSI